MAIQLKIDRNDVIQFLPLTVVCSTASAYTFGAKGVSRYVRTSETGALAIDLLREGLTVGAVHTHLKQTMGVTELTIAPLLAKLISAGMVLSVGSQRLESSARSGFAIHIHSTLVRWLFSRVAVILYLLMLGSASLVVLYDRASFLSPAQILSEAKYSILGPLLLVIGLVNALKHEIAHAAAAAHAGVAARVSLGRRFVFPVLQTDLTDLWATSAKARYIAYFAGMASDLLTLSGLVITTALLSWRPGMAGAVVPKDVGLLLSAGVWVIVGQILWQFNVFTRTDLYYVLASLLNSPNLHGDARAYMKHMAKQIFLDKKGSAMEMQFPRRTKIYAASSVAGYCLAAVGFLGSLASVVHALHTSTLSTGFINPVSLTGRDKTALVLVPVFSLILLAYAHYRATQNKPANYRIQDSGDF